MPVRQRCKVQEVSWPLATSRITEIGGYPRNDHYLATSLFWRAIEGNSVDVVLRFVALGPPIFAYCTLQSDRAADSFAIIRLHTQIADRRYFYATRGGDISLVTTVDAALASIRTLSARHGTPEIAMARTIENYPPAPSGRSPRATQCQPDRLYPIKTPLRRRRCADLQRLRGFHRRGGR